MPYEPCAITERRERRRGCLSLRVAELLSVLSTQAPSERLTWYQSNRGRFFFDRDELPERIRRINQATPQRKQEVTAAAVRLLRHEFDILGSGVVALGDPIDWQRDFKSGIRWRNDVTYPAWNWRRVDEFAETEVYRGHFYSIDDPSDLKAPWDLSSFLHLPALGEAFLQTGDDRYAGEVSAQLHDWHRTNPYPRGVNWTCAMVAGIRLANIVFALRQLEPEPFLADSGLLSILRHLKFILDFLEVDRDGRRNNHYVNNLVGLGFGAVEIAGSPVGADLLDFVHEELQREILTEFSADGTNFEGSIPYHRFAAESVIVTAILLERNARPLSAACRAQLRRVLRFIDVYTKSNGLAPQFGDNDNGRILVLHDYAAQDYRDHRHILAVGAAWLGLEDLTTDLSRESADVIWLLGEHRPQAQVMRRLLAGLFHSNGYAAAKTADSSLLLRCGRIDSMSGGGHNHCDQLSLEFHDRGGDVIVDPGALVYSADAALRNLYRSTAAHNVVQLDDIEQQDFSPDDLFSMQDRAAATVDIWETGDDAVHFRGRHWAYAAEGWVVTRDVRWNPASGALHVSDGVEPAGSGAAAREFCGRLHFAHGIDLQQTGPAEFFLCAGRLGWQLRFIGNLQIELAEGLVSPGYGIFLPAAVIEYRFPAAAARTASFTLERVQDERMRGEHGEITTS